MDTFTVIVNAASPVLALIAVAGAFAGYVVVRVKSHKHRGKWEVEVREK